MRNSPARNDDLRSGVRNALLTPKSRANSVTRRTVVSLRRIAKGQPLTCLEQGCAVGIISGTACLVRHTQRGKRQVVRLLMAGDIFGFLDEDPSLIEGEAVTDVTLAIRRRHEVLDLLEEDPALSAKILKLAAREQTEARERMQLISWGNASARLAWFLLKLMEHNAAKEGEPFPLPFRRIDIADYLALTIETASRTFTRLKAEGLIWEDQRQRKLAVAKEKHLRNLADSY